MFSNLSDFHFIRPAAFALLPLAVCLWLAWQRRADPLRGWREQMQPDLLEALVVGRQPSGYGTARGLLVAWLVAIVAVAGPTWKLEPSPFADDATPLLILLKADISMETPDPAPSRLERARLKIADLANARSGQPLGLIAYSGSAHLVLPPTRATQVVAQMAAEISPDTMPVQGDRLDLAIKKALQLLEKGGQGGSMVVFADSVDTEADLLHNAASPAVSPQAVAVDQYPVQIFAVNSPDSAQSESVRAAAALLQASVVQLQIDDQDIATIVRRAASSPHTRQGDDADRWQEAGYWLVPVVAVFVLLSFRREEQDVK